MTSEKTIQEKQAERNYQLREERVIQGGSKERKEGKMAEQISGDSV